MLTPHPADTSHALRGVRWAARDEQSSDAGPPPGAVLLPAFYCNASGGNEDSSSLAEEPSDTCHAVVVRLAIIDFLRQWSRVELAEHLQKSLVRDLVRAAAAVAAAAAR